MRLKISKKIKAELFLKAFKFPSSDTFCDLSTLYPFIQQRLTEKPTMYPGTALGIKDTVVNKQKPLLS